MREWWRRNATVRLQTTLVAVAVTSVALFGAAFAVLDAVRSDVRGRLETQLQTMTRLVARQLVAGVEPRLFTVQAPVSFGFVPPTVRVVDLDNGELVFAIEPAVSLASKEGPNEALPVMKPPPEVGVAVTTDPEDVISHSVDVETGGGRYRVTATTPASLVSDNTAALRGSLAAGFPVLVVLVGVITWLLAGRSLSPVEKIRAQVEEISAHTLDRRVPAPATDDEVGRLAATMNRMLGRLESSARRQREFVSDASHELRSPIASMRTELEVALREPTAADWKIVASNALAENARLEGIVDDLLTLARLDEGRVPAAEDVDLDDVAREEAARLRDARVTLDCSPARVRGNREQLARALRNLLENAARYANERIAVSIVASNGSVEMAVADDGPGIPEAERERVFERFTRLDEARARSGGGVGLGLALVRAIAEAHGGTASAAGDRSGARLVVRLPLGSGSDETRSW